MPVHLIVLVLSFLVLSCANAPKKVNMKVQTIAFENLPYLDEAQKIKLGGFSSLHLLKNEDNNIFPTVLVNIIIEQFGQGGYHTKINCNTCSQSYNNYENHICKYKFTEDLERNKKNHCTCGDDNHFDYNFGFNYYSDDDDEEFDSDYI